MCENSRQRVIHISIAVAVIFLALQVACALSFGHEESSRVEPVGEYEERDDQDPGQEAGLHAAGEQRLGNTKGR